MTHDTGLVEAVAIAIWDGGYRQTWADNLDENDRKYYLDCARAALDAVNASGTHAVVPVEPTGRMTLAGNHAWCGFNESVIMGPLSPGRAEFTAIYKAMLTAAKEQP